MALSVNRKLKILLSFLLQIQNPLKLLKLIVDLIDMLALNRPLALWTAHEGKLDSKSRPFVLQQLYHTICMEDVPALKANTWFLPQLTGITDLAEVFLRW